MRNPQGTPAKEQQEEIQVVQIMTSDTTDDLHHTFPCVGTISTLDSDISELLSTEPISCNSQTNDLETAQWTDPEFKDLIDFLANNNLPVDPTQANKVVAQAPLFALIDGILYFIDSKKDHCKRCVVPKQMRAQIIEENHSGPMAGHFSVVKLYKAL